MNAPSPAVRGFTPKARMATPVVPVITAKVAAWRGLKKTTQTCQKLVPVKYMVY